MARGKEVGPKEARETLVNRQHTLSMRARLWAFLWEIRAEEDGAQAERHGEVTATTSTTTEVTPGNWDLLRTLTLIHPLSTQTETTTAAERQQRRRHRPLPQLQYPAA